MRISPKMANMAQAILRLIVLVAKNDLIALLFYPQVAV